MMKIAFYSPHLNIGGVEQSFVTLANLLYENGKQVDFVVCQKGILVNELSNGIHLFCLHKNKSRQALLLMIQYILKYEPNYIITGSNFHNEFVLLANLIAGNKTKVICTQHNYYNCEFEKHLLYKYFYKQAIKIFYPLAYRVITVSDGIEEWLKNISKKINSERIYNTFNSVYIHTSANNETAMDDLLPKDYIFYGGRLVSVKNLEHLFHSYAILQKTLPHYSLVIAGSGPEKDTLHNLSIKLKISDNIVWLGDLPNCYRIIKKASLIAITSYSEALPSLVIESLTLGKTVVATPNKGAIEVLSNGKYGYLTKSFDNPEEFAELMLSAINNPIGKTELMKRAEIFNSKKILAQYLLLMKDHH